MKFDQEVQKMMWEIKRAPELVIKGKMVNTQDNNPNKESLEKRRKKKEIPDLARTNLNMWIA
jgi:hypothetical protein